MQKSTNRVARKRQRARESGLCIVCFTQHPHTGRSICVSCNASTAERVRRKRRKDREAVKRQQVTALQERAGDVASTYHLYADATRYYQEALNVPVLAPADRERITEKIGHAFSLNGDPKSANLWFERLLTMYRLNPQDAAKSIEALFQMQRQLMLDCKGEEILSTIRRAVEIAETSGDPRLATLTQLRRVEVLQLLDRFNEAAEILQKVGHIDENDDALLRGSYFVAQAWSAGAVGNAENAYENFELTLELTKKDMEPDRVALIWSRYGLIAHELGDITRAKACWEQALFVARQYRITWMISQLTLRYAQLLTCMGQSVVAYPYLLEALSSSSFIHFFDVLRAWVGIPLALQAQDQAALARCAHPKTIDLAFQSEMSDAIGGVACAFTQLYIVQGRPRAARALLHRALEKISIAFLNLDVLITIARHGALADIPRARVLLEARTALPHAKVFHAGLALFDAFVEYRRGSLSRAKAHAQDSAARFDALQWYGYAELARSIVPGADRIAEHKLESTPFSHMPALTSREREVAALVLRGFTNREIASELRIALHTVEKHMNSILNRLGVRSRYQVADFLGSASH